MKRVFGRRRARRGGDRDRPFLYVHVPSQDRRRASPLPVTRTCTCWWRRRRSTRRLRRPEAAVEEALAVRETVLDTLEDGYLPAFATTWSSSTRSARSTSATCSTPRAVPPSRCAPRSCSRAGSARTTAPRTCAASIIVGAGTHPGAGVPAVLASGKIAAAADRPQPRPPGRACPPHRDGRGLRRASASASPPSRSSTTCPSPGSCPTGSAAPSCATARAPSASAQTLPPLVRRPRHAPPVHHRWRRVSYASRFLEGRARSESQRTGRIAYSEFATDPCRSLFARTAAVFHPEVTDSAKVNIVRVADRYLALAETPIQVEFDPVTLATVGVTGWDDSTFGRMTTVHPHLDAARGEGYNLVTRYGALSHYVLRRFSTDDDPSRPARWRRTQQRSLPTSTRSGCRRATSSSPSSRSSSTPCPCCCGCAPTSRTSAGSPIAARASTSSIARPASRRAATRPTPSSRSTTSMPSRTATTSSSISWATTTPPSSTPST